MANNTTNIVLISTYELGRQPFGLASPAAWLAAAGASVACLDLAVQPLDEALVAAADVIAFYIPMHTATRIAAALLPRVRAINPAAHLCFYGLYAPVNEGYLRSLGAETILGGEFEQGLAALIERLEHRSSILIHKDQEGMEKRVEPASCPSWIAQEENLAGALAHKRPDGRRTQPEPTISLARQRFLVPDRSGLPPPRRYAHVVLPDGGRRVAGYAEASRGCKHTCRHCPIVPVYGGAFRVVQPEVVLADIRQQVAAGAQHITFGDPDFFNGPAHALRIVTALHDEFPDLSYDVTIKIEHLLRYARHLPALRDTGCLFVTSAVEAVDDDILAIFDKRHTRADFVEVAGLFRGLGMALNPTFVTFTPWTTPRGYFDLLQLLAELDLVEAIAPIQYAIRLLIPAGSRLLELPAVRALVGPFDEAGLCYRWAHPDARVDRLYEEVLAAVKRADQADRRATFGRVWELARAACGGAAATHPTIPAPRPGFAHAPAPRVSEPWFC